MGDSSSLTFSVSSFKSFLLAVVFRFYGVYTLNAVVELGADLSCVGICMVLLTCMVQSIVFCGTARGIFIGLMSGMLCLPGGRCRFLSLRSCETRSDSGLKVASSGAALTISWCSTLFFPMAETAAFLLVKAFADLDSVNPREVAYDT